jgi:hypothetical protein
LADDWQEINKQEHNHVVSCYTAFSGNKVLFEWKQRQQIKDRSESQW